MRILFDSKQPMYKDPFGTLTPGQICTLHLYIPASVGAVKVHCLLTEDAQQQTQTATLERSGTQDGYEIWRGSFSLETPGLYFYYFQIFKPHDSFRLFKQGNDTNMEAGDLWQVTCVPADFTTPDWAKGAVIYQVFPDRFCKAGECDLTEKLTPYTVHARWDEEVDWAPTADGKILNNDFFGGNFRGITEKMDYIASLGTSILYLNPISKSFSSHRYDTGDYKTPDPMLGTEADFSALCDAAHARGIRVVLDGVYSHTGSDSLYFDKNRSFGGNGAYHRKESPYYPWYTFYDHPDAYQCWWDFDTLPTVKKMEPSFLDYVITGEDSVVAHWMNLGADGFRLDVVDELPNEFVKLLKERIRSIRPDALLIGEVWEDASNKIAYNIRRRYFTDGVLDSCMNYPFRTAILHFLRGWDDGNQLRETVMTIAENYPPQVLACNMNLLGSHDTPRILTALMGDFDGPRAECARHRLTPEQRQEATGRLLLASVLQYTLPGSPSVYYADEVGMEGCKDPFNRRTYPWGQEDLSLLAHYRTLGALRIAQAPLRRGNIRFFRAGDRQIGFTRALDGHCLQIYVNCSDRPWELPPVRILYGRGVDSQPDGLSIRPMGFCIGEVN